VIIVFSAVGVGGCGGGSGPSSLGSNTTAGPRGQASLKPATGVQRFMIGGDPWAAAAAGGDVWVADHNDGTLTRIDGRTGRVRSRQAVAAKPASAIGSVAVGDRVWVGVASFDKKGNDLAATRSADARTGKLGPLRFGPHDAELAFGAGGGAAYVGAFGYLARIPFDGGRSTTVKLGKGAVRSIGVAGNTVWVGVRDPEQPQPDQIVSFDARSLRRGASVMAAGPVTAITPAAGSVWVAASSAAGDSVVRLDPHSGRELAQIDAGEHPTAIAADGSGVWILDYFASAIKHIAARTNTVDQALTFAPAASTDLLPDNSPHGLAVLPGAVWVTLRDSTVAYRVPVGR
jgi:DNA-binding beta-propeller fold protein YncE